MDFIAVYARYSTAGQNVLSIERQIEACEAYAQLIGKKIYKIYFDEAISGATTVGRHGLEEMVRDAKAGMFEGVALEHVDRLARDLGIAGTVFKKLQRAGVSVHVPGRGPLSLIDLAFQAVMGDETRRVTCERTQFGIRDMAREGKFPSGPCFGYVKVPGQPGVLDIDPAAAAAIVRVFEMRAEGIGRNSISKILNQEGFKGVAGRQFVHQTVKGILNNDRYRGMLVYGRHKILKDTETGVRSVHANPRSNWIVAEVPGARIVDQDLWDRARAVELQRAVVPERTTDERPSYLLSGRVRCPKCDNVMHVAGPARHKQWHCYKSKDAVGCDFAKMFSVNGLDTIVLHLIANELQHASYVEAYVEAYNAERGQADERLTDLRAARQRRVDVLTRKWTASFDRAVTKGFSESRIENARKTLEWDLEAAERELAATPANRAVAQVDKGKMTALRDAVQALPLKGPIRLLDEAGLRVAATIRQVVSRIDLTWAGRGRFDASVTLRLGSMIHIEGAVVERPTAERVLTGAYQRTRGRERISSVSLDQKARYAGGHAFVTDADWEAVRHLLPAATGRRWAMTNPDPRLTVEVIVMALLTGTSWNHLSQTFGGCQSHWVYRPAQMLRTEEWVSIAETLAAQAPERFGALPELSRPHEAWAKNFLTKREATSRRTYARWLSRRAARPRRTPSAT
ncbi:hypothetical protein ASF60_05190 [Methylobacterium sp. Leaf113]|nr:hypothetical protein ASF60_05190 [Methylobacterium sp. Leaf113]